MADQNVFLIIDGSGSMSGVKHDVVNGINEFIDEQKHDALTTGDDVVLSLTAFDTNVREVIFAEDIALVNHVSVGDTYFGGSTALYDAIGKTLSTVKRDKTQANIVVIYSDGGENASREFKHAEIEKLIDELQNEGWSFIYLGAEFADFAQEHVAQMTRSAINTSKATVGQTFRNVSSTTSYHRGLDEKSRLVANQTDGGVVAYAAGAGATDWYDDPLADASKAVKNPESKSKTPKKKS